MTSGRKILPVVLSLALVALAAGTASAQEQAAGQQAPAKAAIVHEGVVKAAVGVYMYIPQAQGLDFVLQGYDAAQLVGKDVRVTGELLIDKPSIFRADSVEVKDASGAWSNVFTRSQDLVLADYIEPASRDAYAALEIADAVKAEQWEGKGKAKIRGRLQEGAANVIAVVDAKGKEVGKILVDSMTDYARYYLTKLRLFKEFWFYLNVKDSIDKKVRPKTKELFHADVVFGGLF
jgi:hypothetical protein